MHIAASIIPLKNVNGTLNINRQLNKEFEVGKVAAEFKIALYISIIASSGK